MKSPSGGGPSWGNKSKNFSMPVKSADRLDFMKNRGIFGPEPDPRDLPQYEDKKSWGDTLEGYIRRAWAQHKPRELEVARAALREWGEEDVSPELRLPQLDLRIRNEFASRLLYVALEKKPYMEDIWEMSADETMARLTACFLDPEVQLWTRISSSRKRNFLQ